MYSPKIVDFLFSEMMAPEEREKYIAKKKEDAKIQLREKLKKRLADARRVSIEWQRTSTEVPVVIYILDGFCLCWSLIGILYCRGSRTLSSTWSHCQRQRLFPPPTVSQMSCSATSSWCRSSSVATVVFSCRTRRPSSCQVCAVSLPWRTMIKSIYL